MLHQNCPFTDIPGFVAGTTTLTGDYEYIGVLIRDIKTDGLMLCVVRRLITDRPGAGFSAYDTKEDGVPNVLLSYFTDYSPIPTFQHSISEVRSLLQLPAVITTADRTAITDSDATEA